MIRLAKISVIAAHQRKPGRQLGVNERSRKRDQSAENPNSQNQRRGVHLSRNNRRIDENACADDSAHHHHRDRKSTRLNSSHGYISYAVFCLKKKKKKKTQRRVITITLITKTT